MSKKKLTKDNLVNTYFTTTLEGYGNGGTFETYDAAVEAAKKFVDARKVDATVVKYVETLEAVVKYPVPDFEVEKYGQPA